LTWALPSLAPGTYQLSYETQVNNFVAGGTVLTNRAVVALPGSAPVTSAVPVTVYGSYTVKIAVYNEAGELIDTILTEQLSQPLENIVLESSDAITSLNGANNAVTIYYGNMPVGVWNGMTSGGTPATNGGYYIKVDNVGSTGVDVSTTQQVTVSRTLYTSTILIYNEAGEAVKHLYSYTDDPGLAGVSSVQLSATVIRPGSSGPGMPNDLTISLSNGTTVVWDGTGDSGAYVQSGQYLVEVHTTDGKGGEETVVKEVSVDDRNSTAGAGVVTARPNLLRGSQGPLTTTFHSDSSESLSLRVTVYTVAGRG
jgi:flagellar hook assembly protein FlgD